MTAMTEERLDYLKGLSEMGLDGSIAGDELKEAVEELVSVRDELTHAHEVFSLPKAKLDESHCAWCKRAWTLNYRRRRVLMSGEF